MYGHEINNISILNIASLVFRNFKSPIGNGTERDEGLTSNEISTLTFYLPSQVEAGVCVVEFNPDA